MDDDAVLPLLVGAPAPIVVMLLVYMVVRDAMRHRRPRRRGRHEFDPSEPVRHSRGRRASDHDPS